MIGPFVRESKSLPLWAIVVLLTALLAGACAKGDQPKLMEDSRLFACQSGLVLISCGSRVEENESAEYFPSPQVWRWNGDGWTPQPLEGIELSPGVYSGLAVSAKDNECLLFAQRGLYRLSLQASKG